MRKPIRWMAALAVVAAATGLACWRYAVNQQRGCPPELLRQFLEQDVNLEPVVGRPARVRRVRRLNGAKPVVSDTVITYGPSGEPLHAQPGPREPYYHAAYSYNGRGWLTERRLRTERSGLYRMTFLYLPAKRRIEIEDSRLRPRDTKSFLTVIRLGPGNRYIDMVGTYGDRVLSRTRYEYDRSGRVSRETWVWPGMRRLHPLTCRWSVAYRYDARGNVIEQRNYDASGKLISDPGVLLHAYKYDRVGNWTERRLTFFSPGRNKWRPGAITTRTISYR